MPRLTFAVAPDGLPLPALIGLDATAMRRLRAQGTPLPNPLHIKAQVDTGTMVTSVGPSVLASLGAVAGLSSRTQTAGGLAWVQHYWISFTIYNPSGQGNVTLSRTSWPVTNLPQDLPDVDVLFGMDLVRELILIVNGPANQFTLDF